ncbi:hypothetical protein BHE90_003796 [Fusarium euwallaceae]|uniref:Uncharacterized protein n=4 Tax=Fusarium solani species complex TaxID=232080 RepID=A0A3M2REC9_9HYPO|nr:hypothetical protein CDV36_014807 [Fusarium kuroshium]RSL79533.1 hypothetical protein CEP51_007303 [Fusarium floridanum]RSL98955.1 hypothetical protein CDV31_012371 [Fusarium ambrosium]RTE81727.1 hypothetical protein BHE90_003796 [Fusarium euwallaceae]
MSLEVKELTKDDAFFDDANRTPFVIDGVGQMVYWKGCFVLVYKSSDTTKALDEKKHGDGEARVERGTTLWFGSKGGRVKQE